MQGETALLTRLIEELQDLALAESGRLQLQVDDCDLANWQGLPSQPSSNRPRPRK